MKFEYKRTEQLGIEKQPRVRLIQDTDKDDALTIEATSGGIKVYGRMNGVLESKDDLNSFAEAVSIAFMEFHRMKQDLRKVLSGRA